jgi:hypothetical protein
VFPESLRTSPPAIAGERTGGAGWVDPIAVPDRGTGGALATPPSAFEWSVMPSPNPLAPTGQLSSVSCSTAMACTAVGSYVRVDGVGATLAERSGVVEPTPNARGSRLSVLSGVACASASSCMAVGRYLAPSGTFRTLAERFDGRRWSIVATPSPADAAGSVLNGIACTLSRSCMAVGSATDRSGFASTGTLVERWDGRKWRVLPAPSASDGALNSVSCSSASACTAVGSAGGATLAER